jgi:hypothetical protein
VPDLVPVIVFGKFDSTWTIRWVAFANSLWYPAGSHHPVSQRLPSPFNRGCERKQIKFSCQKGCLRVLPHVLA